MIDYENETGIPIYDVNMGENLNAVLGTSNASASALHEKITKKSKNNGGLEIVKKGASRNRYTMMPSTNKENYCLSPSR